MEVFALVGRSGTGKSFRAVKLARQLNCEIIIDDGLVIKGNSIIAGVSAKKQPTRIGAIKTALFTNAEHKQSAIAAIQEQINAKILILGTSKAMTDKIVANLKLSAIKEYIEIDQIASAKEIRKARTMRTQHSKHVIPAPIVEVKKSFPESIISPLRIFMHRHDQIGRRSWTEQSLVRPTFTLYGKFTISQGALASITNLAALNVQGVLAVKHVHIPRGGQEIGVELAVILNMRYKLDDIVRDIQYTVKSKLEKMTGLSVTNIDVTIIDVRTGESGFSS